MNNIEIQDLIRTLKARIPSMSRGFIITTRFGDIFIDEEYAEPFRNLAFEVFQYQLNLHHSSK